MQSVDSVVPTTDRLVKCYPDPTSGRIIPIEESDSCTLESSRFENVKTHRENGFEENIRYGVRAQKTILSNDPTAAGIHQLVNEDKL